MTSNKKGRLSEATKQNELTHDYLVSILEYDKLSGIFIWKKKTWDNVVVGSRAGSESKRNGVRTICIGQRKYLEHRLAWFFVFGAWPPSTIDHKDRVHSHNWIDNLRPATPFQQRGNLRLRPNKVSQYRGVSFNNEIGLVCPWRAQLRVNGHSRQLGYYASEEEAHLVYEKAAKELWGEYYTPHTDLKPDEIAIRQTAIRPAAVTMRSCVSKSVSSTPAISATICASIGLTQRIAPSLG